jgi:hypothetical protein
MISKKAPAFLGTPPGEGRGGRGNGGAGEGYLPAWQGPRTRDPGDRRMGIRRRRERSDEPLPLPGAAAPSSGHTGGVAWDPYF